MKKSLIAILMTVVISLSLVAPLVSTVNAAEPSGTYKVINGVLNSDYYVLYPFEAYSVNVGFSKYGELLGIPAGADPTVQANWVGLEYGSRDPFAPASVVPMTSWINGWYIDMEYIDPALSGVKRDRHLWAFAMFSDGFGFDGDWAYAAHPGDNPGYGRQTNGACVTDPLVVLYDGPREYIVMSKTHIYDKEGVAQWPVVDVAITLRFDKVMKEVTLYKDVKLMLPKMHLWGKLDVQFSNREEYDLGPYPSIDSYAHFYRNASVTSYGPNWQMAQDLLRENQTHFLGDGVSVDFVIPTTILAEDFIKVWIDGVFVDPSKYTVNWATKTIHFAVAPPKASDIEVHYKYIFAFPSEWNNRYDVAQIISSDGAYVAWSGMWPLVSDWTVDGILRYLDPLVMVNEDDCVTGEPKQSPLLIGEWDFLMDHTYVPQFRAVEVKGIAYRHDAQDSDHGDGNVIDREATYQLDAVFKPWDLYNAVEKQDRQWLEWKTSSSSSFTTAAKPCLYVPTAQWDQYNVGSERVIAYYSTGPRLLNRWWGDYSVSLNAVGQLVFTGLPSVKCKILYSTRPEWFGMTKPSWTWTLTNKAYTGGAISLVATTDLSTMLATDPLGATWGFYVDNFGITLANTTALQDGSFGMSYVFHTNYDDLAVKKQTTEVLRPIAYGLNPVTQGGVYEVTMSLFRYEFNITAPRQNDIRVVWAHPELVLAVSGNVNATLGLYNATVTLTIGGGSGYPYSDNWVGGELYHEKCMGRYEWVEVGRDAAAVDNTGAAMVAEAFDSYKDIRIGLSGNDMLNAELANQAPRIMGKMTAGTEVLANYKDALLRAGLADDWCTYWPVASSNIIGVGGPLANLFAYYANDFEDAFYGLAPFAGTGPYAGYVTGIPCWNRNWRGLWNVYSSGDSSTIGYAVISTTMDINGTVLFNVWGHWGRDTYYACQWLHGDEARDLLDSRLVGAPGIQELQLAPRGLTSIILQINYGSDPTHPTYTIPECLGTISETLWYCYGNGGYDVTNPYKGGIHDP